MAARLKLEFDMISIVNRITSDSARNTSYKRTISRETVRREFANRCIDEIEARCDAGIDKNGQEWDGYSKSYAKSRVGKIYGKREGATATLKLTGAMRANISVTQITDRGVEIGFRSGKQNDKAHGHVNGSRNLPVRDFWGLPNEVQERILLDTIKDFQTSEDLAIDIDFGSSRTAAAAEGSPNTILDSSPLTGLEFL